MDEAAEAEAYALSDFSEVNRAFAAKVYRALKPGGLFLIETMNKSWIVAHWLERSEGSIGDITIKEF